MRPGESPAPGRPEAPEPRGAATTPTWSMAFSRHVLQAHWRSTLVVMRLAGLFGGSGWPPRWSRAWARYACAFLLAYSLARAALLLSMTKVIFAKSSSLAADISYVYQILTYDIAIRSFGLLLIQVAMVCHSRGLCLLVRAAHLYLHSFSGPVRRHATRHVVILWFGVDFTFHVIHSIKFFNFDFSSWISAFQVVNGLLPSLLMVVTQDFFVHMVSASVDFLAAIGDGVQEHMDSIQRLAAGRPGTSPGAQCFCSKTCPCSCCPARLRSRSPGRARISVCSAPGEHCDVLALGLRALRMRYQRVHDVVHETSWMFGWFNLITCTLTLIAGVAYLYSGVILLMVFAGVLDYGEGNPFDQSDGAWLLGWGAMLIAKLIFTCAIGEQMRLENHRISSALQTGVTCQPDMDLQIEREIQCFIRQTQMQEIRFGAFDLYHFDFKTMSRIIASGMTYLVILVQFSAISAHGR